MEENDERIDDYPDDPSKFEHDKWIVYNQNNGKERNPDIFIPAESNESEEHAYTMDNNVKGDVKTVR